MASVFVVRRVFFVALRSGCGWCCTSLLAMFGISGFGWRRLRGSAVCLMRVPVFVHDLDSGLRLGNQHSLLVRFLWRVRRRKLPASAHSYKPEPKAEHRAGYSRHRRGKI